MEILDTNGSSAACAKYNPKGVSFLWGDQKNRKCLDAWGTPYHVMLDLDSDHVMWIGDSVITGKVAVWSEGQNKSNEWGRGDDILARVY
jgi:hypothetical protein